MSAARTEFDASFIRERIAVDAASACWNWTGAKTGKEGRGVYNQTYAYRISYEVFVGPIPAGLQINHHCDNPRCVNPEHLYAGTQAQNTADMFARGRAFVPEPLRGAAARNAYPDAVVDEVRQRYQAGETQKDLAAEFGVSAGRLRVWVSGGGRGRTPIKRQRSACGTRAGYCSHQRRGEKFCEPCRQANSDYLRAYKAQRHQRGRPA